MKRLLLVVLSITIVLSLTSVALSAASFYTGIMTPFIVTVQQDVPVSLTVGVPLDGEIITATVPLTIGVDLRITVDGATITTTAPSSATVTVAPVVAGEPDADGRVVEYDLPPTIRIDQVHSGENKNGLFTLLGELTNVGSEPAKYIRISVNLYDAAGVLLSTEPASTGISVLDPEQTTSFEIFPTTPAVDVVRYKIQIEHG